MGYRTELNRIILSLSPYRLIAYCAIFLVVRSDATKDTATGNGESIDQRLGNLVGDASLGSNAAVDLNTEKYENVVKSGSIDEGLPKTIIVNIIQDTHPDVKARDQHSDADSDFTESMSNGWFDDTISTLRPIIDQIPEEICRKHSRLFLHHLRRYKMWALQIYDSSAKLPSGLLKGNANQLGDYDQCLSVDFESDDEAHIAGKYCLALVDIEVDRNASGTFAVDEAVSRAQAFGFIKSTLHDPGHFIPQFTTINWGFCLPSSCSSADLQLTLQQLLAKSYPLKFNIRVDETMCSVREKKPISPATTIAIAALGSIVLLAVIATLKDCCKNDTLQNVEGKFGRFVSAFSIQRNWIQLRAELPAEGDIHCIHGIRAICTIMLYAAHKVIPLAFTPYTNRVELTKLSLKPMSMIFRASLIYTDSFLLISGVLTAYNLSKEMQRSKKIEWAKRYAARFIRLTPALLALVIFYAYIFEHLGEGPLWNKIVKTNADLCKENLWTNVLYIQNFFPFQNMCATHTHQLALDMQLSLLSPMLIYLLYKSQLFGGLLLIALHVATAATRYFVTLNNHLSLIIYHAMPLSQLYKTANLSYSLSLHRATPYLMGVGVGYFIYRYEKTVHIPKLAAYCGWLLAVAGAYLSVFAPSEVADLGYVYSPRDAAVYAAYSSVTWSLALGWVICACALGHGGSLNGWLSSKCMVFTSRISYSMYLTQFAVFFYNVGSLRTSQEFELTRSVSLEELFIVLLVSVVMTLLFDLPMQELKGIITGSARSRVSNTSKNQ